MTEPTIYDGAAPQDVLQRHPGQAYMDAFVYSDGRPGATGVCLMLDLAYQASDFSAVGVSPEIERFASAAEAKDAALQIARKHGILHVYLRVE